MCACACVYEHVCVLVCGGVCGCECVCGCVHVHTCEPSACHYSAKRALHNRALFRKRPSNRHKQGKTHRHTDAQTHRHTETQTHDSPMNSSICAKVRAMSSHHYSANKTLQKYSYLATVTNQPRKLFHVQIVHVLGSTSQKEPYNNRAFLQRDLATDRHTPVPQTLPCTK